MDKWSCTAELTLRVNLLRCLTKAALRFRIRMPPITWPLRLAVKAYFSLGMTRGCHLPAAWGVMFFILAGLQVRGQHGNLIDKSSHPPGVIRIDQERNERWVLQNGFLTGPIGQRIPWDQRQQFMVKGRFHPNVYADSTASMGLLMRGGQVSWSGALLVRPIQSLKVQDSTWHDSPVLTLDACTLSFSGLWQADNNYSKPILNLLNGARMEVLKGANIQLVFPAYGNFTRQLWVRGDGTGRLVLKPGYVADLSQGGKRCEGNGCIRLYDALLESQDEAGLPVYYRPEPKDNSIAHINSHLVSEKAHGKSGWVVSTQAQDFRGGLWLYDSTFQLVTDKRLRISGRFAHWSDYTNYGGTIWVVPNATLVKTGKDTLELAGDWHTPPGSVLEVKQGTVTIGTNPGSMRHERVVITPKAMQAPHGQHLRLRLAVNTTLVCSTDTLHLAELRMEKQTVIHQKRESLFVSLTTPLAVEQSLVWVAARGSKLILGLPATASKPVNQVKWQWAGKAKMIGWTKNKQGLWQVQAR